jgi:hypothetical protein
MEVLYIIKLIYICYNLNANHEKNIFFYIAIMKAMELDAFFPAY